MVGYSSSRRPRLDRASARVAPPATALPPHATHRPLGSCSSDTSAELAPGSLPIRRGIRLGRDAAANSKTIASSRVTRLRSARSSLPAACATPALYGRVSQVPEGAPSLAGSWTLGGKEADLVHGSKPVAPKPFRLAVAVAYANSRPVYGAVGSRQDA